MPSIELTRDYDWTADDVDAVLRALATLSNTLLGADTTFRGNCESDAQPDETVRFETPAEFVPFAPTAGAFDLAFRAYGTPSGEVTLGRWRGAKPARLRVGIAIERKAEALAAIDAFGPAAGLQRAAPDPIASDATERQTFVLRRRYRASTLDSAALLDRFLTHAAPLTGASPSPIFAVVTPTDEGEVQVRRLDDLRGYLAAPLRHFRADLGRAPDGAALEVDARRRDPEVTVELRVAADRRDDATAIADAFERDAALVRLPDGSAPPPARRGLKVAGFTRTPMTAAWLDTLAAALESEGLLDRQGSVRLRVRRTSEESTFGDVRAGLAESARRWNDLLSVRLDLWGEPRDAFVVVEPKLHYVSLEVRAADEPEARAAIGRIEQAIGVAEAEVNYQRWTTQRVYPFRSFDRDAVSSGIETAIRDFVSVDPVIREGDTYVADADASGALLYEPFDRLEDFVARLADARPFAEAQIVALGPSNGVVSLRIGDDQTTFTIRTSFEPPRFQDLTKKLVAALKLDPKPKADDDRPGAPRTVWQQVRALEGIYGKAVVGAAVVLSSLTTFLVERMTARDTIAIIAPPPGADGAPRAVAAGCVALEWEVHHRALFDDDRTLMAERGTVQVDAGDGRRVARLSDFASGSALLLPPGRWVVYVYDEVRRRRSASVTLDAALPAGATAAQPAPTPSRCDGRTAAAAR